MDIVSRRRILAGAAVGSLAATRAFADGKPPLGTQGVDPAALKRAGSDPGPSAQGAAALDPDAFSPPSTDHGDEPIFKASFNDAWTRRESGGWARQVTVKDFPISKSVAGVDMRLIAGGVRELHWHLPAEWSYMLYGSARITAVDQLGRKFAADVEKGDLWYFPSGIPHSIQGLGPDGCEFLLAFDDGAFSEDSTLLITDWVAHTPRDVLAQSLGIAASNFDRAPKQELYIFPAPLPGPLADDLKQSGQPPVPEPFNFSLLDRAPSFDAAGGSVRIADSTNFTASKTMAAALVEVKPGGLRALHWHPNADEWQYIISGTSRMTVFAGSGKAHTADFAAGDIAYIERSSGHYIQNTGHDTLRFLEIFNADRYEEVSLAQWLANTPAELVAAHLGIDTKVLSQLAEQARPVVPV